MVRLHSAFVVGLVADVCVIHGPFADEFIVRPEPEGLDSLSAVLSRVAPLFEAAGEGVVVVDGPAALRLGLPRVPPAGRVQVEHDALSGPRGAGWRVSQLAAWSTFWGEGRPSVHLAVHPWLSARTDPLADSHPVDLVWQVGRYHQLAGGPYHSSPGVSGVGLLRDRWRGRLRPYWQPEWSKVPKPVWKGAGGEDDMVWWTQEKPKGEYRHSFDVNRMYLAAAALANVAVSELKRTHNRPFSKDDAGYWLIDRPVWNHDRMPSPIGRRPWDAPGRRRTRTPDAQIWVATPTMALLADLADAGYAALPVVHDSWTTKGGRVLRTWAETLNRAILQTAESPCEEDAAVYRVLKESYRSAVGMLAHDGSRVLRYDWRHTVVSVARCNLWRKLWRIGQQEGRWPVEINVDSVTYVSDDPDYQSACPSLITIGTALGEFKHDRTEKVSDE